MIDSLAKQFHEDGFLVLPGVLSSEEIESLKSDLEIASRNPSKPRPVYVYKRMFERSEPNLRLFEKEPVVSLAERIINDDACQLSIQDFTESSLQCHVIHNNNLVVPSGERGISSWHQDDPPHYIVTDGNPPKNVHLPVLAITVNYYLTDVTEIENGPTLFLKGSHLWGKPCPKELDETVYKPTFALGAAGTAVMFNCQTWHRGSANTSDRTRYVAQVTYARRFVGHKYWPFINYQLPEHIVSEVEDNPRLKRLVGFFDRGAYG